MFLSATLSYRRTVKIANYTSSICEKILSVDCEKTKGQTSNLMYANVFAVIDGLKNAILVMQCCS